MGYVRPDGKGFFTQIIPGPDTGEAARLSIQYLAIISCLFCIHGSLMIMRNTLQGMGYSVHVALSGVGKLLGWAWLVAEHFAFAAICLANPFAWALR